MLCLIVFIYINYQLIKLYDVYQTDKLSADMGEIYVIFIDFDK